MCSGWCNNWVTRQHARCNNKNIKKQLCIFMWDRRYGPHGPCSSSIYLSVALRFSFPSPYLPVCCVITCQILLLHNPLHFLFPLHFGSSSSSTFSGDHLIISLRQFDIPALKTKVKARCTNTPSCVISKLHCIHYNIVSVFILQKSSF